MLENKKIVLLIPALNEEQLLGGVLDRIPEYIDTVVVIDDGSTDRTVEIARSKGAQVVSHTINKGVGAAFQTGIEQAKRLRADVVVNMDADGQFNPDDIIKLAKPIVEGEADFVTASRFKDKALYPQMSRIKFWGNKQMARFISRLTQQKFYDVSCGFRAYSKETILRLNLFGEFTYTQESFIDLAAKKLVIKEVPVVVIGKRQIGKSRVASNLFKYAYQTSKIILRAFRDFRPFSLFGYVGLFAFIVAFLLGVFLLGHYVKTGFFTPHKWAGFVSGVFLVIAIIMWVIGFILDMFARMRTNQEEILYRLNKIMHPDE